MIYDVNSPLFRSFLSQKGGASDKRYFIYLLFILIAIIVYSDIFFYVLPRHPLSLPAAALSARISVVLGLLIHLL
ncbi:hypothetical protein WN943_016620 [Citrus x changshan-huyou]